MTKEEAHELVSKLKQMYPNPRTGLGGSLSITGADYCVAGAFCMYKRGLDACTGVSPWFPGRSYVADELMTENPALYFESAQGYAQAITENNDDGYFDAAWKQLEEALCAGSSVQLN